MRTNGKTPVVIFSLNNADLLADIKGPVQVGRGCYKGKEEEAFALNLSDFTQEVRDLLKGDGQECVLLLDNQYNAWLSAGAANYPSYSGGANPTCQYLGEFKEVDQARALKSDGWSEFAGKFYVAG